MDEDDGWMLRMMNDGWMDEDNGWMRMVDGEDEDDGWMRMVDG